MNEQKEASKTYVIKKYEHRWEEIKFIGDWPFEWGYFEAVAEIIAPAAKPSRTLLCMRFLQANSMKFSLS